MKVPFLRSEKAFANSSLVFITMGPCHATGSLIGLPATNKNLTPSPPALREM